MVIEVVVFFLIIESILFTLNNLFRFFCDSLCFFNNNFFLDAFFNSNINVLCWQHLVFIFVDPFLRHLIFFWFILLNRFDRHRFKNLNWLFVHSHSSCMWRWFMKSLCWYNNLILIFFSYPIQMENVAESFYFGVISESSFVSLLGYLL
jgi:hypothetical protein